MRVAVKGRVSTIQNFINVIRLNAHCVIDSISYPECWKFARKTDYQSVVIEVCGNYFNLDTVRSARFSGLEVSGSGASFSFVKKRGSRQVDVYQKIAVSSESHQAADELSEESCVGLSDYDTMEVYEAKLKQMNMF